nr:uncharacterized protein LOC129281709 [Lytechinus pictus]
MPSSEREPLFSSSSTSVARGSTSMTYDAALELAPSRSQSVVDEPPPESMKQRMRRSVWFPISFVFGFVFFITLVEHGVRFNVVLYTEKVLEYTKGNSPILIAAFDAIAPCLPLIGGWLGGSWFTRSKVTITGAFATLLGIIFLTINVAPYSPEAEENFSISAKRALFVLGFTLLFVGLALYGANDYVIAAREIERGRGLNNNGIRNMFCVEVSYVEAPYFLKGIAVGMFLLMSGVGSYILAQLIILIVNGISGAAGQEWYTEDLNTSRMEYFYCILAAILILDILYIYLVTRKYERADWESVKTKVTMDDENDDDENVDTIFDDFDGENREYQEQHALEISDTSSLSER